MPSNIHNLDRDALLMLYHAGELSEQDRAEIDAMLARDPALRLQLEELAAAHEATTAAIASADAKHPLPAPVTSSVRKASVAMAQWQVDRLARKSVKISRPARKFAWAYGVAGAAAMIFVTIFILWSRVDDGKNDALSNWVKEQNKALEAQDDPNTTEVAQHDPADDYTPTGGADVDVQLTRVEGDLYTLSALTDSLRADQEAVTP